MKKLTFIISLAFFLGFPKLVDAHILKIDGNIGVILHINPEDDPIAGEPSHFHLDFTDKTSQFRPEECICTVDIYQEDKKLYTLFPSDKGSVKNKNGFSFIYTFPKKDIYRVILTGRPKRPNEFQSFSLTYDVRVGRDAGQITSANINDNSTYIVITVLGTAAIFLLILYIMRNKRTK
jgi:hypothetical protein